MIVTNKTNLTSGNNALAPKYRPQEDIDKERQKRLEKSRKESLNNIKQKKVKSKVKVLRNIALVFIIGLTIIYRYSVVYSMQLEINGYKTEMNEITSENDNLKLQLLKYNNWKNIEDYAVKELNMIQPDKNQCVYIDLSKDNFNSDNKNNSQDESAGIIEKIKKMLF